MFPDEIAGARTRSQVDTEILAEKEQTVLALRGTVLILAPYNVDTEILVEKEQTILELRETVVILETKVKKLEQLVRLKDAKIQALSARLP
ncbi:hypothetical protein T484DRAFT_1795920 [Baffinella frigidus]|nr:hypothetical protein T484DRAFT_1795920 [Cryptophyta sp. CCMP2293]